LTAACWSADRLLSFIARDILTEDVLIVFVTVCNLT
jgi:hypothetical protein